MLTGKLLIDWGFKSGRWFGPALLAAQNMEKAGYSEQAIFEWLQTQQPAEITLRTNSLPFGVFVEPENEVEQANVAGVITAMDQLMRVPTVQAGAVMPDACPAGTIPVGGVVATKDAIHPGFHSADVCCSMAMTVFNREMSLKKLLDVAQEITHFGPGGRKNQPFKLNTALGQMIEDNSFTKGLEDIAQYHLGTQGDGNHFLFVGTLRSTGQPTVVTHHGSRGFGAELFRRGNAAAQRNARTFGGAAWIDANSKIGEDYWEALKIARLWTIENHAAIHDAIQQKIGNKIEGRVFNEHNFVFKKSDGLFYHAKGATPSFNGFETTLIPMNMAEPILVCTPSPNREALGFAPHGAGRNMSRTQFLKKKIDFKAETKGLDVRSYSGTPDLSELPSAYKSAQQVIGQINKHKLTKIVDYVDPYGSIMAGQNGQSYSKKAKKKS